MWNAFEEALLSFLLVAVVLVSFSQVVARYVLNSAWGEALELTALCFAWMTLIGMSYCVRIGAHLGVDAITKLLPKRIYYASSTLAALLCVLWAMLLFYTAWFTGLFGTRDRGGALAYIQKMHMIVLELEEMPLQHWIAYIILPIGLALFAYRCLGN
ncbi:MAG: TRAP transporter small permease subunit [Alphaproteobacteria bacterium]|nr:TRAP transporter small permease subunit [Alphaproteobacteria bacterium]